MKKPPKKRARKSTTCGHGVHIRLSPQRQTIVSKKGGFGRHSQSRLDAAFAEEDDDV